MSLEHINACGRGAGYQYKVFAIIPCKKFVAGVGLEAGPSGFPPALFNAYDYYPSTRAKNMHHETLLAHSRQIRPCQLFGRV